MIDILFFERTLADLKKFAFKIASEIKKIDQQISVGAIAIEMPGEKDKNEIDFFVSRRSIKNIDDFLKSNNVRVMVFTQTRIPDMEFILHCKKLGIKTIMIQEGVMFDGMNINDVTAKNAVAILGYLPKVFEYAGIVKNMCKYDSQSLFKIVKEVLKKKRNVTLILQKEFSVLLLADYVLTMGEYWDDYYMNEHGYKKEQIRLIGDHDLDGFTPEGKNEAAICYIANVLVEDGTVKKKDFDDFIQAFAESVDKNAKLYIKLHPRSNKDLYKVLDDHNVEYIRSGSLPSTNVYVGHRSALLGRALYESDTLIIWRFACEEVCFYEQYATSTCTHKDELKAAMQSIDINNHTNRKREIISKVYWNNPEGSMSTAAKLITDYLNKKSI